MNDTLQTTLQTLENKLKKFKKGSNGYTACCPAHHDQNPSLSIAVKPEKVLVKCHVGCTFQSIVSALGMKEKDFFVEELFPTLPKNNSTAKVDKSKVVAKYDYCDINGVLLYQVVRKEPKAFSVCRPDPDNPEKFVWNIKGVERVMYKLPELLTAIENGKTIHITEGEKDCNKLIEIGYSATTMSGGAKAPYPKDFGSIMRDADVVIWGDNDKEGVKCAEGRAEHLTHSYTTKVKVCYAPPKFKDICEWIEAGATKQTIDSLVKETEYYESKLIKPVLNTPTEEVDIRIPPDVIIECLNSDEYGDGTLLKQVFKGLKLYDHTAGAWLDFKNGYWQHDRKEKTIQDAFNMLYEAYKSIMQSHSQAVLVRLSKLQKLSRIKNALEWARSGEELRIETYEFDSNPYHINLRNGVYELDTLTFRKHRANDLHLKQAGAEYGEGSDCPKWIEFTRRIFNNDTDLIEFIQMWVGLCLSGTTDAQGFFYAYGRGANGKSTFFTVLQELLGSYFVNIPVETLLQKRQSNTDEYQLTKLHGSRLVVCSEIPENRRPNEGQIKDLTGGEYINARHPFGKPYTFKPTHKLALFGNHKLKITGTDGGIWRRVWLIPFTVTIPESERRPMTHLLAEFRNEINGILMWAIMGWIRFKEDYKGVLQVPPSVKNATQIYRDESDVLADFFKESCEIGDPLAWCLVKDLYQAYKEWCSKNDDEIAFKTQRAFTNAMKERDFNSHEMRARERAFGRIKIKQT